MRNKNKRIQDIQQQIRLQETVRLADLARRFRVSSSTIRRDIKQLEEKNIVIQTIGGKVIFNEILQKKNIREEATTFIDEKIKIAECCINYVDEYDDIIIGPGTTPYLVGKILSGITNKHFRIITNSLDLAAELSGIDNIQIVIPGGTVIEKHTLPEDHHIFSQINYRHAHKAIISVDGIDVHHGLTVFLPHYVSYLRHIIGISSTTILVSIANKFGKTFFHHISNLDAVQMIISDASISKNIAEQIKEKGIDLVLV